MSEQSTPQPYIYSYEHYDFSGDDWLVQLQLGEQETRRLDDPTKRQEFLAKLREQSPLSERYVQVYLGGNETYEARSFVSTGVVLRQREAALASGLSTVFDAFVAVYSSSVHFEDAKLLPVHDLGSTPVEDAWFALPALEDGELEQAKNLVNQEREHSKSVTHSQ